MKQVDDGTQLIREGKDGLEVSRDKGQTWSPGPDVEQWQKDAKDLLQHHGKEAGTDPKGGSQAPGPEAHPPKGEKVPASQQPSSTPEPAPPVPPHKEPVKK